jgi:hypothetical protein
MLFKEAEKAVHADFGAEDASAVVGEGVVFVVAGAEIAGDGVEVDGETDAEAAGAFWGVQ